MTKIRRRTVLTSWPKLTAGNKLGIVLYRGRRRALIRIVWLIIRVKIWILMKTKTFKLLHGGNWLLHQKANLVGIIQMPMTDHLPKPWFKIHKTLILFKLFRVKIRGLRARRPNRTERCWCRKSWRNSKRKTVI